MQEGRIPRASEAAAPQTTARILQHLGARLAVPGCLLIVALVLPSFMFDRPLRIRVRGLGPDAWPTLFLNGMAVLAVLWIVAEIWGVYAARKRPNAFVYTPEPEAYDYRRAIMGIGLILAFGWLLPVVGFAISATLFIFCWCLLGGIRNPVALVLLSLLGMITLLWVFMGLALMPLSRGTGVFDTFSVWFLRLLRIY